MITETHPTLAKSGYASVNGLEMYYEIHGAGRSLVLLHGGLGTIEMFGHLLPSLAQTRRVIAIEQQGHGRTADIDRPLRSEQMADDTAALLQQLKIDDADVFGISMGAGVALQLAIRHPHLVRKLVVGSGNHKNDGIYPEVLAALETTFTPEAFAGSPIEAAYLKVAPNPGDWPTLVRKVQKLTREFVDWSSESIRAIAAPTLLIVGDSDIIRPEVAVEMFRLRGGGVPGDFVGLPSSQLAVLPGTTHMTLVNRVDLLLPILSAFLDAPMPEGR
ncbi:MAG: alpha/beta fold hydrolase [Chroococcidiopsis sp.]